MLEKIVLPLLALAATAPAPSPRTQAAPAELPGVDASSLTATQRAALSHLLDEEFCYCGCPHTVATCLREHRACKHAPRMAALAVRLIATGAPLADVRSGVEEYYAGFERSRRAKLDLARFGPPLGKPDAPVALVEFSDFTCPFCRAVKPELERFVREHEGRVRLYYKPYPILSHPRALEAALAAEWARDQGHFWKMHDLLFARPGELSDDDLAADAREVGGDPDDLLHALAAGRDRSRVLASQAEARAAGLLGTPTLFFDGHLLKLPLSPAGIQEVLTFALEDEEEWIHHGGWARD